MPSPRSWTRRATRSIEHRRSERRIVDRGGHMTNPMAPGFEEVHILWTSEGMSCDGDSVSVTAASLPSIEDVVLGAIPGLPKVYLHNKVLAFETGEDFMKPFHAAANDELGAPFIFVVEGSI